MPCQDNGYSQPYLGCTQDSWGIAPTGFQCFRTDHIKPDASVPDKFEAISDLADNFELYFENRIEKDRIRTGKYNEFSLEYALSQVFSPKQKELFKKKLEGVLLNKTEKEYYSRTVKKKVVALANSELHNLSRKLLEQ